MDMQLKEDFIRLWKKYFNDSELPITFYYANELEQKDLPEQGYSVRCIMGPIRNVRKGKTMTFNAESVKCFGGKRYLGFLDDFDAYDAHAKFFMCSGLPGQFEGERFKKSPEISEKMYLNTPRFEAPASYCVFKRWDMLDEKDTPEVVIFFVKPDILSALFFLANYDTADLNGVIAPWSSGCSSIVQNPYLQKESLDPKAILGMFDISARPFVAADELSLSAPMKKIISMLENMDESFLSTKSWEHLLNSSSRHVRSGNQ